MLKKRVDFAQKYVRVHVKHVGSAVAVGGPRDSMPLPLPPPPQQPPTPTLLPASSQSQIHWQRHQFLMHVCARDKKEEKMSGKGRERDLQAGKQASRQAGRVKRWKKMQSKQEGVSGERGDAGNAKLKSLALSANIQRHRANDDKISRNW